MQITNQSTIDEWSLFSDSDLESFGEDGDEARTSLLDPYIFELLGDITGKTILDAGSGNGHLSRKLAKAGAKPTALEPAINLYSYSSNLESAKPLGITHVRADLTKQLDLGQFESVVMINVLMDIPDWFKALKNCVESLRLGGTIVISILHPAFPGFEEQWQKLGYVTVNEYFNAEPIKQKYGYLIVRPIQDYINALIDLHCRIDRIVEPQSKEPSQRNAHVPQFLIIKATKHDETSG